MQYLIILMCALLSCTKVTTQGYVAKGNIKSKADSIYANCVVFAFVTLIFSFSVRGGISTDILLYAVLFGICSSGFQIFYALALEAGPFSATCMIINLSMAVNIIFACIYYGEALTVIKLIGLILCLFALFLNSRSDGKKVNVKWVVYVALAFISTSGIGIVQKVFAKSSHSGNVSQLVFMGYLVAFIVTFVMTLFTQGGKSRNFKLTKKNILLIIVIAASLGLYQNVKTYGDSFIDAIVLNPCASGLATTFQMISGKVIFKENFSKKQIYSICVGILAILLISL